MIVFQGWSRYLAVFSVILLVQGCAKKGVSSSTSNAAYCSHPDPTSPVAGSTGTARIFNIDPMVSANSTVLSPGSSSLDSYASTNTLTNLLGYGNLRGTYVYVVTDRCIQGNGEPYYGSYSASNAFSQAHSDERFAETMSYFYGNLYRAELDAAGALYPTPSFQMIANCDIEDNAYYSQKSVGGSIVDYVCIGHPSNYPSSTFADDAEVFVHEIQHGTTGNAYSTTEDFNKFYYDEAGAINEAVSDFAALMQEEPSISAPFQSFEFSRWALGQFFSSNVMRGAGKCPIWTADYPTCANYAKTTAGFSAANKRVSFAYPDGLGWPYAGPTSGSTLKAVWEQSSGFEEIHQTAPIITGALYDAYIAAKAGGAFGTATLARRAMYKLLVETIKALPKASASDPSPVTMPIFASTMVTTMNTTLSATFNTAGKQNAVSTALDNRGLITLNGVADGWASAGTVTFTNAAIKHPGVLFYETKAVGIANNRLQAGEKGLVWFDIKNADADTAAAPLLKVTINGGGGKVRFSNASYNPGYVNSTTAYVRYGKINGSGYVAAVNDSGAANNTGMTTDYITIKTISTPQDWMSVNLDPGLYIETDSSAAGAFSFDIDIKTANSSAPATHVESISFPVSF